MTFDRISRLAALCLLAPLYLLPAFLLPSSASAQGFQGVFTGDGVMMTLQPSRDRFYGTLVFDDGFYSIEAVEKDGELSGSFVTPKGEFDFKAVFRGSVLELETNSITYVLRRVGDDVEDEPEAELAAAATELSEPEAASAEPSAAAEPPLAEEAPETTTTEAGSGGVIYSTDFEEGALPTPSAGRSESKGPRHAEPVAAAEPVFATEPVTAAEPVAAADTTPDFEPAGPVDEALVGTWQRGTAASDAPLLASATDLELTAAGVFTTGGASGRGLWKAEEQTLYLRPEDTEDWQPYCRYKLVGDSLLCTLSEDSRELWFRR